MNDKKFRRSGIAIACYAIAGIVMLYAFYSIGSTISYLVEYFGQYGMSITDNFGDAFSYIVSAALQPIIMSVLVFMAGYILEEVRSQNPAYYVTDAELAAAKAAKAEAKAAAKAAKTEAKAAAAEAKAEEAKVEDAE